MKKSLLFLTIVSVLALGLTPAFASNLHSTNERPAAPAYDVTVVFSNSTTFTIPGTGEDVSSTIVVSGINETVLDVNVHLYNFTSTQMTELDFLLVGPGGQNVILFSYGCAGALNNRNWSFDDESASTPPGDPAGCDANQVYQPTDYSGGDYALGCMTGDAPTPPYGSALSNFDSLNPNGTWTLWSASYCGGDTDSTLAGGWALEFLTTDPVEEPGEEVPAVNYPNRGEILISAGAPVVPYAAPGEYAQAFTLPADYDGNGFDTYVITATATVGGATWYAIWVGGVDYLWVPASQVQTLR